MKYVLIITMLLIILLGIFTCPEKSSIATDTYRVVRVVDGDTFIAYIDGKDERIRLIGVDTPESVHPNKDVEHYALEASDYLKTLLKDERVYFKYDQSNSATNHKDRYDRTLAYAYRASDSLFINAEIIKQGYGFVYTSYPFTYLEDFLKLERDARMQQLGLWGEAEDTVASSDSLVWFNPGSSKYHRNSCRYTKEGS
ncbi:MAG: thermonuclease family protein, partial [Candidatus Cloacimonetes bacterium]|nr:thermonuclease family protein [Candidatus Cloacimonadota bacterium]